MTNDSPCGGRWMMTCRTAPMARGLLYARAFTAKRAATAQASAKSSGAAVRAALKAPFTHDSHALLPVTECGLRTSAFRAHEHRQ